MKKRLNLAQMLKTAIVTLGMGVFLIFGGSRAMAVNGCPCSCKPSESSGSYRLTGIIETVPTITENVSYSGAGSYAVANASGDLPQLEGVPPSGMADASVHAYAIAYWPFYDGSASGTASATGQKISSTYGWSGPPSAAPGATFGVQFEGTGSVVLSASSAIGGSAAASGGSIGSGSCGGQFCTGSENLNSVQGGVSGVTANANSTSQGTVSGGVGIGSATLTLSSSTGTGSASITSIWSILKQGTGCLNAGAASIVVVAKQDANAGATATATASLLNNGSYGNGVAGSDVKFTGSLSSITRCDTGK